jgi:hypothetical protein
MMRRNVCMMRVTCTPWVHWKGAVLKNSWLALAYPWIILYMALAMRVAAAAAAVVVVVVVVVVGEGV